MRHRIRYSKIKKKKEKKEIQGETRAERPCLCVCSNQAQLVKDRNSMLRLTSIGSDDDDDTDGGERDRAVSGGSSEHHRRVQMTWTKEKTLQYRATHSGCSTPEGFRDMLSIRP